MKSLEDLQEMHDAVASKMKLRMITDFKYTVMVSSSTHALMKGSRDTINAFIEKLHAIDIPVKVMQDGYIEPNDLDPLVEIIDADENKVTYCQVTPERVDEIIEKHIKNNTVVDEFVLK